MEEPTYQEIGSTRSGPPGANLLCYVMLIYLAPERTVANPSDDFECSHGVGTVIEYGLIFRKQSLRHHSA